MDARLPAATAVLLVLGAGLWWVAYQAPDGGQSGTYDIFVVAPDGAIFANGTFVVDHASALDVLFALAGERGFPVGSEESAGFTSCSRHYVRSIGPFAETATGGWNYYTRRPGQQWEWQSAGAGCGLPIGVQLEWCWVELDVCRYHAP